MANPIHDPGKVGNDGLQRGLNKIASPLPTARPAIHPRTSIRCNLTKHRIIFFDDAIAMNHKDLYLEHAPIVEAVIAIDLGDLLNDEEMKRLELASEEFKADYPESEPLRQIQFQFGIAAGQPLF